MKLNVKVAHPTGYEDEHEGFWIDAEDTSDGTLEVDVYDETGDLAGRRVYAKGYWHCYYIEEMPSKDALALRDRIQKAEEDAYHLVEYDERDEQPGSMGGSGITHHQV